MVSTTLPTRRAGLSASTIRRPPQGRDSAARAGTRRPRAPVLWLPTALWSAAIIGGLVWLAGEPAPPPSLPGETGPLVLRAPPPAWTPLPQPVPLYALDGPESRAFASIARAIDWSEGKAAPPSPEAGLPQAYAARRNASGGREDVLVLGGPAQPLHLRIEIRRGVPEPPPTSFYIDLVRRAAEAGLAVTRNATPAPVATKFGPVEAASTGFGSGAACLAFRFAHPDLSFRIAGWLCGTGERPPDDAQLVCALDRLVLAPGGEDPALRILFAQAERRRTTACASMKPAAVL